MHTQTTCSYNFVESTKMQVIGVDELNKYDEDINMMKTRRVDFLCEC